MLHDYDFSFASIRTTSPKCPNGQPALQVIDKIKHKKGPTYSGPHLPSQLSTQPSNNPRYWLLPEVGGWGGRKHPDHLAHFGSRA